MSAAAITSLPSVSVFLNKFEYENNPNNHWWTAGCVKYVKKCDECKEVSECVQTRSGTYYCDACSQDIVESEPIDIPHTPHRYVGRSWVQ